MKTKGFVQKSASAIRTKRKRNFKNGHAKPWAFKEYKDMKMGERVQIDHMTVTKTVYVSNISRPGIESQNSFTLMFIQTQQVHQQDDFLLNFLRKHRFLYTPYKWIEALNLWLILKMLAMN